MGYLAGGSALLVRRTLSTGGAFDFRNGGLPNGATLTRASAGTYFNAAGVLSTALTDVARFTYDPTTLALEGLLNEPQRTNLLVRSAALNTTWGNIGATITEGSIAAPDGTTAGNKFTETAITNVHEVYQAITLASAASLALSGFVQASSRSAFPLSYCSVANNYFAAVLDASGVAISQTSTGATSGTITASGIRTIGASWRRGYVVGSCTGANATVQPALTTAASGNTFNTTGEVSYLGDITKFGYWWGLQAEAAADVSSYIPTVGSTVTRSADVLTLTMTAGTYDFDIYRLSGLTQVSGADVSGGTYVVPTDVSPLQRVIARRTA